MTRIFEAPKELSYEQQAKLGYGEISEPVDMSKSLTCTSEPQVSGVAIIPSSLGKNVEDTLYTVIGSENGEVAELSNAFKIPGTLKDWKATDIDNDGDADIVIKNTEGYYYYLANAQNNIDFASKIIRDTANDVVFSAVALAQKGNTAPLCRMTKSQTNGQKAQEKLAELHYPKCPEWQPSEGLKARFQDAVTASPEELRTYDTDSSWPFKILTCAVNAERLLSGIYPNSKEGRVMVQRLWDFYKDAEWFQRAFTGAELYPFLTTDQLIDICLAGNRIHDLSSINSKKPIQLVLDRGLTQKQEGYLINSVPTSKAAAWLLQNYQTPSSTAKKKLANYLKNHAPSPVSSRIARILAAWGDERGIAEAYARNLFRQGMYAEQQADGLDILKTGKMIKDADWPAIIKRLNSSNENLRSNSHWVIYSADAGKRELLTSLLIDECAKPQNQGAEQAFWILNEWDTGQNGNLTEAVRLALTEDYVNKKTRTAALRLANKWDSAPEEATKHGLALNNLYKGEFDDIILQYEQLEALRKFWPKETGLPKELADRIASLLVDDNTHPNESAIVTALHFKSEPAMKEAIQITAKKHQNSKARELALALSALVEINDISDNAAWLFANNVWQNWEAVKDIAQEKEKGADMDNVFASFLSNHEGWADLWTRMNGKTLSDSQIKSFMDSCGEHWDSFFKGASDDTIAQWVARPEVHARVYELLTKPETTEATAESEKYKWSQELEGALYLARFLAVKDSRMEGLLWDWVSATTDKPMYKTVALDSLKSLNATPPQDVVMRLIGWPTSEEYYRQRTDAAVTSLLAQWVR